MPGRRGCASDCGRGRGRWEWAESLLVRPLTSPHPACRPASPRWGVVPAVQPCDGKKDQRRGLRTAVQGRGSCCTGGASGTLCLLHWWSQWHTLLVALVEPVAHAARSGAALATVSLRDYLFRASSRFMSSLMVMVQAARSAGGRAGSALDSPKAMSFFAPASSALKRSRSRS